MIKAIAIDGPAGAGKSTIAKSLATELDMTYVDTGAMYRAIAIWTMDQGIEPDDEEAVKEKISDVNVEIIYEDGIQQVILDGVNVTDRLRDEETGRRASLVSKHSCVRERLVAMQQDIAAKKSVIMDGRDIGTRVLTDALLKIFMTASADVRAKRRFCELSAKGIDCDFDEILEDIKQRDFADETRKVSPLKPAKDAVILDTSDMDERQVIDKVRDLYLERLAE